jgi:iron complex outermembrane recepter protein
MKSHKTGKKTPVTKISLAVGLALQAGTMGALAQSAAPEDPIELEEVVVTGFRASLEKALELKRKETGMVDAIVAEDIADFPDLNLAESLQRIPGVSITRDGGEGRNISVRGLGPQFTRVRINGIEALATGGGTDTAGGVNRGRGFDFNTFASELFSQLLVRKTSSAEVEEGSLGATVDLRTARPFDYKGFTFAAGGQASYNDLLEEVDPRATALISNTFLDGRLGALLSVAYTDRKIIEEGSDSVRWWTAQNTTTNFFSAASPFTAARSATVFHPRIPRYNVFTHDQERLGATASLQFRPWDRTTIALDGLYAKFDANRVQDNINAVSFSRTTAAGKQATLVMNGEIDSTGNLMYGLFDNVDIRSEGRYDEQTTNFTQIGLSLDHEFSDRFKVAALLGSVQSTYDNPVQTTIIMDKNDIDGYSWDYRGNSRLPVFNYGNMDPLDPNGWVLAEIRLRPQWVRNDYDAGQLDFSWQALPALAVKFGAHHKDYTYESREWRRATETVVPAMTSATLAGLVRQFDFYGVDAASSLVPDIAAFDEMLDIYSGTGIYTLSSNQSGLIANNRIINEKSTGFYLQGDFGFDLGTVPVRGNLGVRQVKTKLVSDGWSVVGTTPVRTVVDHEYDDTLPSLNASFEVAPDVMVRVGAAKVMTRPNLGFLAPGAAVSVSGGSRTVTTGNPRLDPFRAKTVDLAFEWYFSEGALVSLGLFYKDIDSFIQTSRETRPYSTSGLPASLIPAGSGATVDDEFTFQQPLNTPGGSLKGYEISYQQPFSFLPGTWSNFGVQLNYTYADSQIQYLTATGTPAAKGPMVGLSKNAWNGTLYYDNKVFSARVSASYRDKYVDTIPGREGSDYEATSASTSVDASVSYSITEQWEISLEGLNLTDEWKDMWMDTTRDNSISYTHTGRQFMLGARFKF